ncbi:hypothetical protein V441_03595 [Pseudomonas aeruginosa DHS29]|nr:hypothetical protein V441_03595 [Pseudomonas aeruginosa DHS29]
MHSAEQVIYPRCLNSNYEGIWHGHRVLHTHSLTLISNLIINMEIRTI